MIGKAALRVITASGSKRFGPTGRSHDQPAGSGVHVYFAHIPLCVCQRLWVTEGEFKALSMWEAGNPTIGLPGLHCYTRDGNGNPQILPALFDAIRFVQPSEIVFIGDADTVLNIQYYRSAHFLATAFPKVAFVFFRCLLAVDRRASMISAVP